MGREGDGRVSRAPKKRILLEGLETRAEGTSLAPREEESRHPDISLVWTLGIVYRVHSRSKGHRVRSVLFG